ncbi:MAG: S9 family peptidase [Chloroflexota bacterium]|nr:S9 family peptidase [Chloroflexota bacterium]
MDRRPLGDFLPREQVRPMAHTTRRYSGPSAIAISPDGRELAYVSDRGGTYAAWVVPLAGGEPREVIAIEGGAVRGLCWSPSGDLIASADRGGTERWQLYVRRPDGTLHDLAVTEGERVQHHLSWNAASPEGMRVAYSTNAREPADVDAVVADLADGATRPLAQAPAWHVVGGWSPDGRTVLVMRVQDNSDQDLLAIGVDGGDAVELTSHTGDAQHVPAGWLADGRPLAISDVGREHLALVAIDPRSGRRETIDGREWDIELAVSSTDGRVQVWSVNIDGYSTLRWRRDGRVVGERALGGQCEDLVVSADGALAVFVRMTATEPAQVWALETESRRALPVVTTTTPVAAVELVEPELVRIAASDGGVPAFVYRPRHATGPVPAVLYPHGGPEAQSRPAYNHVLGALQCLVARGIAVVVPNIHGSTGYGRSWQSAIHRDWGGIDLRDLRAVSEWMAARPEFDPERLAVYGGSYGGFATLTCITRLPDRWRCAVDLFGVANLLTMLENAQPNWRRFNARWIGDLDRDREKLVERSPITRVDEIRCPLLVIQGANDPRVPKDESDQVVQRLRSLGRRVEYLVFEDEGHGFTKRRNHEAAYERIVEFLSAELLA